MSSTDFAELGISAPVLKAVQQLGYEQPSPVQAQSIPILLEGKNLLGTAQTGTGKTAAFALPFLSMLDEKQKTPQILVLTPTRELAIQVAEAFQTYAKFIKGFHVLPIYGGADISGQLRGLKRGAQVVVGTPGRMLDHLRRRSLDLSEVKGLILDEADEMLRMGFIDDVETILSKTPDNCQRALFSATMPPAIRRVSQKYLGDAETVNIQNKTKTVERIEQQYVTCKSHQKMDALTRVLEVEAFDGMIIFVRTKSSTVDIAERLEARGFSSAALNGDLSQALRERTINRLKKGQVDIVVATDVAARGLDVERISHVINFDIPYDNESYVHRIGRTGRAGRDGKAILFITPKENRMLRSIEKSTRQVIKPMAMPSNEEVSGQRIQQFTEQLMKTMALPKLDKFRSLIQQLADENELDMGDIAAALAFENQKERPLFPKLETIAAPSSRDRDGDSGRERNRDRGDRTKDRGERTKDRGERKEHRGQRTESRDTRGDSRNERSDRPQREARAKDADANRDGVPMVTYRLEVGNNDKITPSNIVGAIANEADIESRFIGEIKLHDEYSTVDLPKGMPAELLNHLKKVRVCAKPMQISVLNGDNSGPEGETYSTKSKPEPRAPRKRELDDGDKKTLSRNVKNKRTAEQPKPPRPVFKGKSNADDGGFSKAAKEKRAAKVKTVADGSAPLKKKKTYTKKPKRS
ncbi:MAG: DEAD/DEAH box helicase [Porticoccaceae bacterium]|jgi:ATP-dependent RNA helicase DeaD|tara:strand:- start:4010 stop:6100 length:2091 start_codon:yes stop_codon:yes gene_type:complete